MGKEKESIDKYIFKEVYDYWVNVLLDTKPKITKKSFEKSIYWFYNDVLKEKNSEIVYLDSINNIEQSIYLSTFLGKEKHEFSDFAKSIDSSFSFSLHLRNLIDIDTKHLFEFYCDNNYHINKDTLCYLNLLNF